MKVTNEKEKSEQNQQQYRTYYERNRVQICQKQVDVYMPNSIRKIGKDMPEVIKKMYIQYPFEGFAEPYLKMQLKINGVRQNEIAFDECCEISMIGYMYSIHRCAYMNYSYTENYIKFMIKRCIVMGLVLANKDQYMMKENNCTIVCLDDERNRNRW